MTSDELFWRLVLVSRTVDEAALLWWLAAVEADQYPYRAPSRTYERLFGFDHGVVFSIRTRIENAGLVSTRILKRRYTEFRLNDAAFGRLLGQKLASGQIPTVQTESALLGFDPERSASIFHLVNATACSRLCMLRGNREEAILLAWLYHAGAVADDPVRVSSRDMEALLCNLVDRRTAMRAMARLQAVGLVAVTPMGRVGTEYRLNGGALQALLATFPFDEAAAATMPGWANLTFPLLQRLSLASSVGTAPTAQVADMEV